MKKLLLVFLILCFGIPSISVEKIQPELLTSSQTADFEKLNESLSIIFSKIKSNIKTYKYPKYYHDFTLIPDDGTQNKAYYYVKLSDAELIYDSDVNELKYISFRRPELQKCRVLYDYPSGKLLGVQVFSSKNDTFMFSANGKYVDYEPYAKEVREKVFKSWKVPSRRQIAGLVKDKKSLLVQIALTVNKDGSVKKCRILKSSKIKELDNNASNAVQAAAPFKPFPENYFNGELVIILNFNFNL